MLKVMIIVILLFSCRGNSKESKIDYNWWENEVYSYNNYYYQNKIFYSGACDSVPPMNPTFFKGKPYYTYKEWIREIRLKNRVEILKAIEIQPRSLISEHYNGNSFTISIQNKNNTKIIKGINTFFDGYEITEIKFENTKLSIQETIHQMGEKINYYEKIPLCYIGKILIDTYYDGKILIVLNVYM